MLGYCHENHTCGGRLGELEARKMLQSFTNHKSLIWHDYAEFKGEVFTIYYSFEFDNGLVFSNKVVTIMSKIP